MRREIACTVLLCILGCAGVPGLPAEGRSTVWGYLAPRPHPAAPVAGSDAYGDRRLASAERVDYERVGFAVVYLARAEPAPPLTAPASPSGGVELVVADTRFGVRIEPDVAVLQRGEAIRVLNRSGAAQMLSCPAAGRVVHLPDGARAEIPAAAAGEYELFVLGGAGARAAVFAAPGPWSVVSSSGRFELANVEPGDRELRAWHPRLPPARRPISLTPGRVHRVDFEIGVGLDGGSDGAP